ncbi:MAG: cysteine desulfurase [Myxococcales bacterium]|nr:cysteine desulfurase [Myxococcales bacterium]
MRLPVYADYNATTPLDERVLEAMLPYLRGEFGNPSSKLHAFGQRAGEAVERARAQVAAFIGAEPGEIVFTSGATESDNLALAGLVRRHVRRKRSGGHLITAATEHPAILESARLLAEHHGLDLTELPVGSDGRVDPDEVAAALRHDTICVSVMAVNNETGVINPVSEISAVCRERSVLFHCDAVQAAAKLDWTVDSFGLDLASVTAHKMYGPKGVGALYLRARGPRARLSPMSAGGGQERGLRPGTLNVAGIVGFGAAAEIARLEGAAERARMAQLGERLEQRLLAIDDARINAPRAHRVPSTLSVSFAGVEAEALIAELPDVALSSGSACASGNGAASHVLSAMAVDERWIFGTLRITLGRYSDDEQCDFIADRVAAAVARVRGQAHAVRVAGGR